MKKVETMAKNIYADMKQENIDKLKKEKVIQKIKEIINEFSEFTTADVDADHSPSVDTKGNLCHLIDWFKLNYVVVTVFESKQDLEIYDYMLTYEELELDTLEYILELAEQFKELEIEDDN